MSTVPDPPRSNLRRRSAPPYSQEQPLRDRQMALWAPKLPHWRLARSRHHRRDRNPAHHPARANGKSPCKACPKQSEGNSAKNCKRSDAPHRARHLCFLRRRHDTNRHSPAQPFLYVLQLCRLSPERKIRLPGPACLDGKARRPRHRKRQAASLHAGTPHQILESLFERQRAKNRAVEDRRAALAAELAGTNEKLKRFYRAIEDGIVDLDAQLKERIDALKVSAISRRLPSIGLRSKPMRVR